MGLKVDVGRTTRQGLKLPVPTNWTQLTPKGMRQTRSMRRWMQKAGTRTLRAEGFLMIQMANRRWNFAYRKTMAE